MKTTNKKIINFWLIITICTYTYFGWKCTLQLTFWYKCTFYFGSTVYAIFTNLLFDCLHLLHVLVEDVLLNKLWTFKLLSTERTEVLVLCDLLCVHLNKPLHFSKAAYSQGATHTSIKISITLTSKYISRSRKEQLRFGYRKDMLQRLSFQTSPCQPQREVPSLQAVASPSPPYRHNTWPLQHNNSIIGIYCRVFKKYYHRHAF